MLLFSPIDLLGINPDDVVDRLAYWGIQSSVPVVSRVLDVIIVVFSFFFLYLAWRVLTYRQRRYVSERIGAENKHFNSRLSRWLFIDTFFLEKPLSEFDTPEIVLKQKGRNLIKEFTCKVFKEKDNAYLHLVLGGSGMGKSSFLVGALRKYVMHNPWNRRYEIVLINLGNKDCIQRIQRIAEKANTILLLDALDENRDAASSLDSFMEKLEDEIRDFPITVITCRTQFFPNYESELRQAGLCGHGSYKDNLKYKHYYIRYFNDWDVKKYLIKKYPFRVFSYVKARKAVSLCRSLSHRPLLLSYIDDIISEKNFRVNNELDLYEKLIDLWIRREICLLSSPNGVIDAKLLYRFSLLLAEKMYRDYPQKRDYFVTGSEADLIFNQLGIQGTSQSFKMRSLIERDAMGNYKFAHRTFMEYFLAQRAFSDDSFPFLIVGLDSVQRFFCQISNRHIKEQEAASYVIRGESEPMVGYYDQIDIKSIKGGLKLKALQAFPGIRVLSFDSRLLNDVLTFVDGTSVKYLRISGYKKSTPLHPVLLHPQIQYLWIDGEDCSKSFLKSATKQGVSVMVNDRLAVYFEREDCPMDFLAAAKLKNEANSSLITQFLDYSESYDE